MKEPWPGCLKIGTADFFEREKEFAKGAIETCPPPTPAIRWYCLDRWLQQEMNGFIFLGNVLLKKIGPGVRGERGAFMIQNPGETVQPLYPCSWSFAGV